MPEIRTPLYLTSTIPPTLPPTSLLPPPFTYNQPPPTLITQGAEAVVLRTHFLTPDRLCALKYRPTKSWRHPILDARLTRHRILSEARILVRCRRQGLTVPGLLSLDWEGGSVDMAEGMGTGGWMMMEWIEGCTVRNSLDRWLTAERGREEACADSLGNFGYNNRQEPVDLMKKIGRAVGTLHEIGIVHGDLTTSNLMLRPPTSSETLNPVASLQGDIVLIDFGLAAQSVQDEDRAVDLYVLERAFGSTHPTAEDLFHEVLHAYRTSYEGGHVVLKKLEDVRLRGRKRSMLG